MEYSNHKVEAVIDEWIHNALHRDLLKSRLLDGLTYERLAEEYDMSVSQVRRILKRGIDQIIKHL